MSKHKETLVVDFDGVIHDNAGKDIGDPLGDAIPGAADALKAFRAEGWRIVIWTVRPESDELKGWLVTNGIAHDATNSSDHNEEGSSSKPSATAYLDNRAWPRLGEPYTAETWDQIRSDLLGDEEQEPKEDDMQATATSPTQIEKPPVENLRTELTVPKSATKFRVSPEDVALADAGETERTFTLKANSGQPFEHGWWGTLVVDIDGIKHKARVPILAEHDVKRRVGVATKVDKKGAKGIWLSGTMLDNEEANAIRADAAGGFPFEASVYLSPTKIERVQGGETAKVNGLTVKGPCRIFRKSSLREGSWCVLGADADTESIAARENGDGTSPSIVVTQVENKEGTEMELKDISEKQLADENPDLVAKLKGDAVSEAKAALSEENAARLKELTDALGDETEAKLAFAAGKDTATALKELLAKERTAHADERKADAELLAKLKLGVSPEKLKELAGGETEEGDPETTDEPKTFAEAKVKVKAELSADAKPTEVAKLAASRYPKLYADTNGTPA